MKNDVEAERRLLDRTVEKLQKEASTFDSLQMNELLSRYYLHVDIMLMEITFLLFCR